MSGFNDGDGGWGGRGGYGGGWGGEGRWGGRFPYRFCGKKYIPSVKSCSVFINRYNKS